MNIMLCIVSTGLLEALTLRGGGIEEIDHKVALELSKCMNVAIVSPFYREFKGKSKINEHLLVDEVYTPSVKNYPPRSKLEKFMIPFTEPLYAILASFKVIHLKKRGLSVIILDNEFTGLLPGIIARILKIKVIFSEGNLSPWACPYLHAFNKSSFKAFSRACHLAFGKLICILSHRIRVQTHAILWNMVIQGISPNKIVVIGGGADIDSFEPTKIFQHKDGILRVGFLGMLHDIKGVSLLLEVVKKASTELPDVSFMIMGDGPYKRFFKEMPNIEYLGFVEKPKLPQYLTKIDVMLFFQKDIGLAELESMATGKTLVALKIGEVPKFIRHMKNGLLCDPNPQSYIEAIRLLSKDRLLLKRLSKAAKEAAASNFSWKVIGKKWRNLIYSLIAS